MLVKRNVFFRSIIGRVISVVTCAAVVVVGGHFVFATTTDFQNTIRLREIARQTLLRAERAADYALITLNNVIGSSHGTCDADGLEYIRRSIYLRGVVKDVRIIDADGTTLCAGMGQTQLDPLLQYDPTTGVAAQNGDVRFHRIDEFKSGLVGVSQAMPTRTFFAIVNVDSLMFDVFPESLRESAVASLLLDGAQFAQYFPPRIMGQTRDDWLSFEAVSDTFPISAKISVSPLAFSEWNRESEPYALIAAGLLGAVLGYFVALAGSRGKDMASALRKALRRREFIGNIQPIFELTDQRIVGGEVLARWQLADGTVVQPVDFIDAAEDNGLIAPITWQIMEDTLSQLSGFLIENPGVRIGFNIAPTHLMSVGFTEDMLDIVRRFGVSPKQVTIEVTERQQFDCIESAGDTIQNLRNAGFSIALDDTGTGHNGLSSVQKLGIDIIKIDKHFVDYVGVDRVATKIIEMLVQLARELNLLVVAEGIETEAQLKALQAMDIDLGQGYLVSKPVSPAKFIELAAVDGPQAKAWRAA